MLRFTYSATALIAAILSCLQLASGQQEPVTTTQIWNPPPKESPFPGKPDEPIFGILPVPNKPTIGDCKGQDMCQSQVKKTSIVYKATKYHTVFVEEVEVTTLPPTTTHVTSTHTITSITTTVPNVLCDNTTTIHKDEDKIIIVPITTTTTHTLEPETVVVPTSTVITIYTNVEKVCRATGTIVPFPPVGGPGRDNGSPGAPIPPSPTAPGEPRSTTLGDEDSGDAEDEDVDQEELR